MRTADDTGRHRRGSDTAGFEHVALFYDDDAHFVARVVDHVRQGLEAEDAVVIALPGEQLGPIREALGADARAVVLQDVRRLGPNPARLVPALHQFADEHPDGFGELYDIEADPWERRNLYFRPEHAAVVAELRVELLDWLVRTTRPTTLLPHVSFVGPHAVTRYGNTTNPDGKVHPDRIRAVPHKNYV